MLAPADTEIAPSGSEVFDRTSGRENDEYVMLARKSSVDSVEEVRPESSVLIPSITDLEAIPSLLYPPTMDNKVLKSDDISENVQQIGISCKENYAREVEVGGIVTLGVEVGGYVSEQERENGIGDERSLLIVEYNCEKENELEHLEELDREHRRGKEGFSSPTASSEAIRSSIAAVSVCSSISSLSVSNTPNPAQNHEFMRISSSPVNPLLAASADLPALNDPAILRIESTVER